MAIFIISAEDTYPHCQPWFWKPGGRRSPSLQASLWHYAVADECNSLVLLGEGMDESFVTTVTIRQYSDAFWYIIGKRKLTSCRLRGLV